ncbi:MAG: DUF177 domain-containing protein [Caldilineaceae bacterium]|nr:DUF177 domain-containing protein [Caldilineaceae bacterium]
MQFNVAQLLKESTGATRTYELAEDLSELDPDLDPLNPLVGTLRLLRTHSGVLVSGELSTALRITCNRCLAPLVIPVRFKVEENFRPLTEVTTGRYIHPDEFEGQEEDLEDEALLINEQHILDIREIVRQDIWLALPMYPTCEHAGLSHCSNKLQGMLVDDAASDDDTVGLITAQKDELVMTELLPEENLSTTIDPRWAALLEWESKNSSDDRRKASGRSD